MASRGGVQSFMQRVSEVIGVVVSSAPDTHGYCLSLNDSTESLRDLDTVPIDLDVWGGEGSKSTLVTHALLTMPQTDVLLVGHLGAGPMAYAMKLINRVRKYYVILHGIEAWQKVTSLKRRSLLAADKIIATTSYTAEVCGRKNNIPAEKFTVIPLCIDERRVASSPDFRLKGEFKLLCVARQDTTEREKGFEHIFKALSLLRSSRKRIHLNMVGDGNYQEKLKAVAAALGVADRVSFWGRIADDELAAAYKQCDLFVMPSRKEGFGIVFLEAMRFGKPCIGGYHGGTPEVIDHGRTGFLCEYGDVQGIARAINKLCHNPVLCKQMGKQGYERVVDNFSALAFAESYTSIMINTDDDL